MEGLEPSREQTYRWLSWLVDKLERDNLTEFSIERMQPNWLETRWQKWLYCTLVGLITGVTIALIYAMTTGAIGAVIGGLIYGIILGNTRKIYPIEKLKFSIEWAKKHLFTSVLEGVGWGILYSSIDAWICWTIWGISEAIWGAIEVVIWGLVEGLIWGLWTPEFRTITASVGIRESTKNAVIFTVIGGVIWVLIYAIALWVAGKPFSTLDILLEGISNALFFGIYMGGLPCVQHFVLRLILVCCGAIPWNYVKFLDYAAERGFLRRESGFYRIDRDSLQLFPRFL